MALIACYECSKQISDLAPACPSCGAPSKKESKPLSESERIIWEGYASHLRYASGWVIGILLLALYGVGLLVILIIILDRRSRTYKVTTWRVSTRTGIFLTNTSEIRIQDIRVVNVTRHGLSGLFGVGDLEMGSTGADGIEVVFQDISEAEDVKELVNRLRHASS